MPASANAVGRTCRRRRRLFALQEAAFQPLKHDLLEAKKPPFTNQKVSS